MLAHSLAITPLAALSRPVAGVCVSDKDDSGAGTMIISLPGSPKGATENLECLLGILPHAVDLATGGSGRDVHAALGAPSRGRSPEVKPTKQEDGIAAAVLGAGVAAAAAVGLSAAPAHHHHHHHGHSHHGHAAPTPRTVLSQDPSSGSSRQLRGARARLLTLPAGQPRSASASRPTRSSPSARPSPSSSKTRTSLRSSRSTSPRASLATFSPRTSRLRMRSPSDRRPMSTDTPFDVSTEAVGPVQPY